MDCVQWIFSISSQRTTWDAISVHSFIIFKSLGMRSLKIAKMYLYTSVKAWQKFLNSITGIQFKSLFFILSFNSMKSWIIVYLFRLLFLSRFAPFASIVYLFTFLFVSRFAPFASTVILCFCCQIFSFLSCLQYLFYHSASLTFL